MPLSPYTGLYYDPIEQQESAVYTIPNLPMSYENVALPPTTSAQASGDMLIMMQQGTMPISSDAEAVTVSAPSPPQVNDQRATQKRKALFWGLGIAAGVVVAVGVGWAVAK